MIPQEVYEASQCGTDISGHLATLRIFARGNVFEIGVRTGVSTSALLMGVKEHGGHVWSLDIEDCGHLYVDNPDWTFLQGHSVIDADRVLSVLPHSLDVLFIDSDHDYVVAHDELRLYGPIVKAGGTILMHDTDLAGAGVRKALEEYAQHIGKQPSYCLGSYGLGVLVP
jgi:predicted O-methyltransferase YrrM